LLRVYRIIAQQRPLNFDSLAGEFIGALLVAQQWAVNTRTSIVAQSRFNSYAWGEYTTIVITDVIHKQRQQIFCKWDKCKISGNGSNQLKFDSWEY
jgi:hypothetical protein